MNGKSYRLKQSRARRRREVQRAEVAVDPEYTLLSHTRGPIAGLDRCENNPATRGLTLRCRYFGSLSAVAPRLHPSILLKRLDGVGDLFLHARFRSNRCMQFHLYLVLR